MALEEGPDRLGGSLHLRAQGAQVNRDGGVGGAIRHEGRAGTHQRRAGGGGQRLGPRPPDSQAQHGLDAAPEPVGADQGGGVLGDRLCSGRCGYTTTTHRSICARTR